MAVDTAGSMWDHVAEDHYRWRESEGTVTVVCNCVCPDCWPSCPDETPPPVRRAREESDEREIQ